MLRQASSFFQNSISVTQNARQYLVWSPCACTQVRQPRGVLPRKRMVPCGMSFQICVRAFLSSCKVWEGTWKWLMDRTQCSRGVLSGLKIRWSWRPHNCINSFILKALPAYSCHKRPGSFIHQEEPRTYCIIVGSDSGLKDFIPIPNGTQTAIFQPVEVCASLRGETHHQTWMM